MIIFYLSSLAPNGVIITTRHFTPDSASIEALRRSLDGHRCVSIQQVDYSPPETETATKPLRFVATGPRARRGAGGRHA